MSMSLAVKYRPRNFSEVCEQSATKIVLEQQLEQRDFKNAYLFCGGAGTGKTTCARIFANRINQGKGNPIELDAASNNSVDDVRDIIKKAKTASLDSEYKVFIMDEVHALSNSAWQAMLKVLEEPPAKSIFIMCTTEKNKIPKTILSRAQSFDFQMISQKEITNRLSYVIKSEKIKGKTETSALEYIAKQAQGHMRDALTMLDKCLSYSTNLTVDNVVKALGIPSYDLLLRMFRAYFDYNKEERLKVINEVYMSGYDLKQFIKHFTNFILDFSKWILGAKEYLNCPMTEDIKSAFLEYENVDTQEELLSSLVNLQADIKWDTNPKSRLEAWCITGE